MNDLTTQEREMIQAMRLADNAAAASQGGNKNEAMHNLISQIQAGIAAGMNSSNRVIQEKAAVYHNFIGNSDPHTMFNEGQLNRAQINNVLADISQAALFAPEDFDSIMPGLEIAVGQVSDNKSDKQIQEEVKQEMEEMKNSTNEQEEVIVENTITGTRFVKAPDGTLSVYVDPTTEEYIADVKASSDEAFINSGGETQGSMFDGMDLETK